MLLDDELPGFTYLKLLCEQFTEIEIVKVFNDPEQLINEYPKLDFDFCIIDIEMPKMNGLQIANLLQGVPVIFTTAYKEYAVDAFELNAIDYIQKPVKKERLQQAINKVQQAISQEEKKKKQFIQLNSDKGKSLLFFDQIALIRTSDMDSRDKLVILQDSSELTLKNVTFEKLKKHLPPTDFCQINKQEIIALKTVSYFSFDEITTRIIRDKQNIKLILSDKYRSEFIQKVSL